MTGDKQHDATAEFNEALAAGFAANNFEALGPFFTEDAVLLPPRGKMLDGRAAAAAFWPGLASRFTSVAFTTVALKDLGSGARREAGTFVMGSADRPPVEGKFVFVWQLVDGEWQIETAIWNRNADAGGGRRPGQGQGQGRAPEGAGRRGGGAGQGLGTGQGGGYRGGGGRPSFQGGGGGAGGRRQAGGQGQGQGDAGGGGLYAPSADLYSNPKT